MGLFSLFYRPFADQIHNCRPQSAAFYSAKRPSIGINKRSQISGVNASYLLLSPSRWINRDLNHTTTTLCMSTNGTQLGLHWIMVTRQFRELASKNKVEASAA